MRDFFPTGHGTAQEQNRPGQAGRGTARQAGRVAGADWRERGEKSIAAGVSPGLGAGATMERLLKASPLSDPGAGGCAGRRSSMCSAADTHNNHILYAVHFLLHLISFRAIHLADQYPLQIQTRCNRKFCRAADAAPCRARYPFRARDRLGSGPGVPKYGASGRGQQRRCVS